MHFNRLAPERKGERGLVVSSLASDNESMTRKRPLNFPNPSEVTDATGVVFRTKDEIVALYKQGTGAKASSLSVKVREWANTEAANRGWGNLIWPLAYPSKTLYAGGVFVKGLIVPKTN